jgi:hypothetical protein
MMSKAAAVSVVVCCETYKFGEKIQLDAVVANEMGQSFLETRYLRFPVDEGKSIAWMRHGQAVSSRERKLILRFLRRRQATQILSLALRLPSSLPSRREKSLPPFSWSTCCTI